MVRCRAVAFAIARLLDPSSIRFTHEPNALPSMLATLVDGENQGIGIRSRKHAHPRLSFPGGLCARVSAYGRSVVILYAADRLDSAFAPCDTRPTCDITSSPIGVRETTGYPPIGASRGAGASGGSRSTAPRTTSPPRRCRASSGCASSCVRGRSAGSTGSATMTSSASRCSTTNGTASGAAPDPVSGGAESSTEGRATPTSGSPRVERGREGAAPLDPRQDGRAGLLRAVRLPFVAADAADGRPGIGRHPEPTGALPGRSTEKRRGTRYDR
jgi:hypothetical protein